MFNTFFAATDGTNFWELSSVAPLKAILAAVGVLVAMGGVFRAVGAMTAQKMGPAIKILGFTLVACVFLFRPATLTDLINLVANLVDTLIGGADEVIRENPAGRAPGQG